MAITLMKGVYSRIKLGLCSTCTWPNQIGWRRKKLIVDC